MIAEEPSYTAFATSEISALVGLGLLIMDSSISVAVMTRRPKSLQRLMSCFWTLGTSTNGISTPRSPLAIMMPAHFWEISSMLSTPALFSILAMTSIFSPPLASKNSRISIMSSFRDTKEAATKSISFLIPKRRSFLSCSLKKSPCMTLLGKFIDFWSESVPPTITSHLTFWPLISLTSRITSPLFMRTLSPGLSCWGKSLYVTETLVSSPSTSSVVSVNEAPSLSSTLWSLNVLILYSGPLVSSMIAIGRLSFSLTLLIRSIFS